MCNKQMTEQLSRMNTPRVFDNHAWSWKKNVDSDGLCPHNGSLILLWILEARSFGSAYYRTDHHTKRGLIKIYTPIYNVGTQTTTSSRSACPRYSDDFRGDVEGNEGC